MVFRKFIITILLSLSFSFDIGHLKKWGLEMKSKCFDKDYYHLNKTNCWCKIYLAEHIARLVSVEVMHYTGYWRPVCFRIDAKTREYL